MSTMRLNADAPPSGETRRDAMYPAMGLNSVVSACSSGTSANSMSRRVPGTRSRLTMRVPPTRSHSTRISRSVASRATSATRPSLMVRRTSPACASPVAASTRVSPSAHEILRIMSVPSGTEYTPPWAGMHQ